MEFFLIIAVIEYQLGNVSSMQHFWIYNTVSTSVMYM